MANELPAIEDIRARCSESITEIVSNPREYYRVQTILRDRAVLLAEVDRLTAQNASWSKLVHQTNDTCAGALKERDALRARVAVLEEKSTRQLRQQGEAWAADAKRKDARIAELEAAAKRAEDALQSIGDEAHDLSTGPTVPDGYWRLREQAYREAEAIGCAGNKGGSRDG